MPRGEKSAYTGKQRRKAEHIETGYESRGVPEDEAERRAWATVNKESGGGKKRRRTRQSGEPRALAQGGKARRSGGLLAAGGGAFGLSEEGSRHPQAQGGSGLIVAPDFDRIDGRKSAHAVVARLHLARKRPRDPGVLADQHGSPDPD